MSNGPQIDQDLKFQRCQWRAQRIGWVLMGLALLAALAGLLGPGPLSRSVAADASGLLHVEYNRFDRASSPTTLKIRLGPGASRGGSLRLWIDRSFVELVEIKDIQPTPAHVAVDGHRLVYSIEIADPASESAVVVNFEHQRFGRQRAALGLVGGPHVDFKQLVYP